MLLHSPSEKDDFPIKIPIVSVDSNAIKNFSTVKFLDVLLEKACHGTGIRIKWIRSSD